MDFMVSDKLYGIEILVVMGDMAAFDKAIKRRYGDQLKLEEDDKPDNECAACFSAVKLSDGTYLYVMWFNVGFTCRDIVHEVMHATAKVLKHHNVEMSPDHDEQAAYYAGWLYGEIEAALTKHNRSLQAAKRRRRDAKK
jgi:hypothetical protein